MGKQEKGSGGEREEKRRGKSERAGERGREGGEKGRRETKVLEDDSHSTFTLAYNQDASLPVYSVKGGCFTPVGTCTCLCGRKFYTCGILES